MTPEPRRRIEASTPLSRGTNVGPYTIDGPLGHGGMGEVYKATDTRLGRFVALKFLRSDVLDDRQAFERLRIEARAASSLNHPNICTIYEIGEHEGLAFIAMELLEGRTLREELHGGALHASRLLALGIQLADGLSAAHSKGIIHRDIKPENVFVLPQDRVKILDFGLAKLQAPPGHQRDTDGPASQQSTRLAHDALTLPGVVLGTPAYMSPEQVRGEELDSGTDLFSLGAVLFEMATGRQAFEGRSRADVSAAVLDREPVLPAGTSLPFRAALQDILSKALEKNREFRYQHASDLAADLRRLKRDLQTDRLRSAPLPVSPASSSLRTMLAADLAKAAVFAALVLFAHGCLERRPSGRFLDQFQVAFLQESLWRGLTANGDVEADGKALPLVVDISRLHRDKTARTDRRMLGALIDELRRRGAGVIGVDLIFDDVNGEDFQYFAKWVGYRNVRIGIYGRALERREAWLGRPEFSELAAGIALPADDTLHAFLYSRRWFLKGPLIDSDEAAPRDCADAGDNGNCKEDLVQLPVALWLLLEQQRISSEYAAPIGTQEPRLKDALQTVELHSMKRQAGMAIEFGEYAIDYSFLKEVQRDVIKLSPKNAGEGWESAIDTLGAFEARIADRPVLVGDLEDTTDQTCPTPSMKPVPGVLIHACALATLNRGTVFRISSTLGRAATAWGVLALLAAIIGVRLVHARSRKLQQWPFRHVEMLWFTAMSVVVFLVFRWQVSVRGVAWPHVLWLCGALMAYPFVSDPFVRATAGMLRALRTATPSHAGRERGA